MTVPAAGGPINRTEAEAMAARHRGAFGDDVVLHDPEDFGSFFACEDCDWLTTYVPDGDVDDADGYDFGDGEPVTFVDGPGS